MDPNYVDSEQEVKLKSDYSSFEDREHQGHKNKSKLVGNKWKNYLVKEHKEFYNNIKF